MLPSTVCALLALAASAQEKVTLKFVPKAGETLTSTEKVTVDLKANANGQEFEFGLKTSEKCRATFVEVADGKVVKKVLRFEESTQEQRPPGTEEYSRSDTPLHGRTVTLTAKGSEVSTEGAEGVVEDQYLNKLVIDEYYQHLAPEKPVAAGESWEIAGEALKKVLRNPDMGRGKISCTLKEFKEVDGKKCAVVTSRWDVSGENAAGLEMSLDVDSTMSVWLERGIPLSSTSEGTIRIKQAGTFEGEGPIKIERAVSVEAK